MVSLLSRVIRPGGFLKILRGFIGGGRRRGADVSPLPPDIERIRQRAANGHVLDQVLWGKVLLNSRYRPQAPSSARDWFAIAARAEYGPAYNMLGRCAQFGWGCAQNYAEAAAHFTKAAELGDVWGAYNLGILAMRGLGMAPDLKRALALFRDAAAKGHAKSMNLIGRFTEEGWETPRDASAALDWYRRSAEGGDYRGQHNYASSLLSLGRGEEALFWWRKAVCDATPDILLAMQRELRKPHAPLAEDLMTRLQERLDAVRSEI